MGPGMRRGLEGETQPLGFCHYPAVWPQSQTSPLWLQSGQSLSNARLCSGCAQLLPPIRALYP